MRLTLNFTGLTTLYRGLRCWQWEGKTECGTRCTALIAALAVPEGAEIAAAEAELLRLLCEDTSVKEDHP